MEINLETLWDFDFDAPNPSEVVKPHHTGIEVAKWLKERGVYGTLLKAKAKKLIASVKKLTAVKQQLGRVCPSCKGSKVYKGAKYTRPCNTCKDQHGNSLGHMTPWSERKFTLWAEARANGTSKTNYDVFESKNGTNKWGYTGDLIAS